MGKLVDIIVPEMAESITEGTIQEWSVQEGQAIQEGDTIVSIDTDKITLEVPSPVSGVLKSISAGSDTVVKVGQSVGKVEEGATGGNPSPTESPNLTSSPSPTSTSSPTVHAVTSAQKNDTLSPAVQHRVLEQGLTPSALPHSGPKGNILKSDVLQASAGQANAGQADVVVPMSRLRQTIARNLKQSQENAVMLTTYNEVNMSCVMRLRSEYKDLFLKKYGVKLGFMSFFIKAVIQALKYFPVLNASVENNDIIYHNRYNIGIAVGGGKGLVVPVIKEAQGLGIAGIEQRVAEYGKKAKEGTLALKDLQGGTFTITNGGVFGSLFSMPIVNPPQSAILGMHGIQQRPIVDKDGTIKAAPMMYLALTYDHRIIDGREAVLGLRRIKECIETPARIIMEI